MKMFSNIKFLLVVFFVCLILTNSNFLKKRENEKKANLEAEAETKGCTLQGRSCVKDNNECCNGKFAYTACYKKTDIGEYYC
jgi:hypothetical protein